MGGRVSPLVGMPPGCHTESIPSRTEFAPAHNLDCARGGTSRVFLSV
jgi:hypothetical protein